MPTWLKWTLIAVGAICVLAVVVSFFHDAEDKRDLAFSEVMAAGRAGDLERIEVHGRGMDVRLHDEPDEFMSRLGSSTDLIAALEAEGIIVGGTDGVEVEFERGSSGGEWIIWIINIIIPVAFLVVTYVAVRNAVREGFRRGSGDEAAARDES
jgi:hypothetical protein